MAKYTHIAKGEFGITDSEHPYSRINVESMFHAMNDLNTMGLFFENMCIRGL